MSVTLMLAQIYTHGKSLWGSVALRGNITTFAACNQNVRVMKRLIIFDLDGTLLNTIADLAQATNHALHCLGYPLHALEEYPMMVGNGVNKLLERALPDGERSEANAQRMRREFVPFYDAHCADLSRPYEGITELLEELQRRGCMLAVASNKYQAATERLVAHYFPTVRFCSVLGQREGVAVKPDPVIVDDTLRAAGVAREETLYVGDSDVDMQTARNAGVDACGVTWGFRSAEELKKYSPAWLVARAEEILMAIE